MIMSVGCIDCKWYVHTVSFDDEYHMQVKIARTWGVFRACVYPTRCRKLDEVHALERPPWCPITNGGNL